MKPSSTAGKSIALCLLLWASSAAFGCGNEDDGPVTCEACQPGLRTCAVNGGESFSVEVGEASDGTCEAKRVGPGQGGWTVHCEPLEACTQSQCYPLDSDAVWKFLNITCYPPS